MTGASGAELIIHNCSAENSDRKCQNVVTISRAFFFALIFIPSANFYYIWFRMKEHREEGEREIG